MLKYIIPHDLSGYFVFQPLFATYEVRKELLIRARRIRGSKLNNYAWDEVYDEHANALRRAAKELRGLYP